MPFLPHFEYHEPESVREICEIMSEYGERAKLLAGGTDLVVNMKKGAVSPERVVSITQIDELTRMVHSGGLLRLGACCTAAELAGSSILEDRFRALVQGASSLGSPLVRNLATIGGNVASARPAADLAPPLMVFDSKVLLASKSGLRHVPMEKFFSGPGKTTMSSDEIIIAFEIEEPSMSSGSSYIKLAHRRSLAISVVNVASFISIEKGSGKILDARIVLGSVAPTPVRSLSSERVIVGEKPSNSLFEEAARSATQDAHPIDDIRGTAGYRSKMTGVLTKRALEMTWEQIEGKLARGAA